MDPHELTALGLTESESRVYLAVLELDTATVGPIVQKAGVQDSKIYQILDRLKAKGMVSYVIKGKFKHYHASDPRNLLLLLQEKKQEIARQEKKITQELLPLIMSKQQEDKQEALVFESIKGLKTAYNYVLDCMAPGQTYYVFNLGDELAREEYVRFFTEYHRRRIAKGVRVRFIAPVRVKDLVKRRYSFGLVEHRFTKRKFPIGTIIFNGCVMTLAMRDKPTAFIIRSQVNYEYYKAFFEDMWADAK